MRAFVTLLAAAACAHHGGSSNSGGAGPDGASGTGADAALADGPVVDVAGAHARADAALETLLLRYWSPSARYLAAASPSSDGALTGYWTFAQALDAVLDGADRTSGAHFAGWIEALYLVQDARGWSRDYYDDENWMTLALLRAYDRSGDAKYLDRAKQLYADIMAAWDTTCCGANPGGIWWDRPHTQKATAANAGPVIAGARLAARTNDASYLAFARQVYAYWRAHMVDAQTYAVIDHVDPQGNLYRYKFTYNEGLMIGAAVELGELADAHAIAHSMLARETQNGVLYDGTNTGCTHDCAQFKGIGYRYLALLHAKDPRDEYAAALAASADAIWTDARAADDRFATDWAGPASGAGPIEAQSSAAMALSIRASSLGAYSSTTANRLEAEDGVVHAIGLEAAHAGFSGWGYLAGWNADGQWVDFHPSVATAGARTLTIRYAAGAGDASRLVYANGANAIANLKLPSTGSWDAYATVTATVPLVAGANTLSIIFNSSAGSAGYVNLDYITVE